MKSSIEAVYRLKSHFFPPILLPTVPGDVDSAGMGEIQYRSFLAADLPNARLIWEKTEGICLNSADSPKSTAAFLERNPGFSQVALSEGRIVGTVLCGHDGRRGFLYHLAVVPPFRRRGVGRHLVDLCLARLRQAGLTRCHIVALSENAEGLAFWKHLGFAFREELRICSRDLTGGLSADIGQPSSVQC